MEKTKSVDAGSASPDDSQNVIEKALHDAFGQDAASGAARFTPVETHAAHVVARGPEGKVHRISYTKKDSGVEFGASQEVQPTNVISRGPDGKLHGTNFSDPQEVEQVDALRSPMQK